MEEDEVKSKLPEIYQSIIKCQEDVDWALVKEDFEDLNWMDFETQISIDMVISVWKVVDRWGFSVLQSTPRFKIFKLSRVKLAVMDYIYAIRTNQEIKEICRESRGKIEDMLFFSCAKSMLYAASEELLPNLALRVYDIYQDFKRVLSSSFDHLDTQLKLEINMDISKLLDEIFYQKVIIGLRTKLNSESSTQKIITELEKDANTSAGVATSSHEIGINTSDLPYETGSNLVSDNNVYALPYYGNSSSSSGYSRENVYLGQLNADRKRVGYGKITYFGGDTYEGYWENDKPNGQGLYSWKIGGKYLGNFVNGMISGIGQRTYPSGNWYCGEFTNGSKNGKGEMKFKNGDHYDGEWKDDSIHGRGRYTWSTGDVYEGRFLRDFREGTGTLTLCSGAIIEGFWRDNALIDS